MAPRRKAAPNDGLTEHQRAAIREVLTEFPAVERAVLFGSRAMGTWSPASDVDLALFGDALTLEDEMRIAARMEDLGFLFTVDLVRHATIKSEALREHIAREGREFCAAPQGSAGDLMDDCGTSFAVNVACGVDEHVQRRTGRSTLRSARDRSNTIRLSETTKFIVDNRGRTAPTVPIGIPLIATNCISNSRLYPAYENLRYVSQETYDKWFRAHPQPGDVILTNKGSQNGAICLVPDPVDFVIAQDMVALRADESVIDPLFLFAALRSPDVQRQIKDLDVSGVIPHFKKSDFDKLHLPYPSRERQKAIGKTYFDFCSKIELNRKMNETLEAMARAIFQSWFVDFDPVHAKARGEQPAGMIADIAALFPSEFEDSELGPIPKGWRLSSVGECCEINSWTLGKNDALPEIDYVEISAVNKGLISEIRHFVRGEEPSQARRRLRSGDTVLSTVRPERQAYFLSLEPPPSLIASTGFAVFTPSSAPWSFVHAAVTRPEAFEQLGRQADGGAYPAISPERIGASPVVLPAGDALLAHFHCLASPLYTRCDRGRKQSETLAVLRDILLPRLISGQLRIPDAERLVRDAIE